MHSMYSLIKLQSSLSFCLTSRTKMAVGLLLTEHSLKLSYRNTSEAYR